MSVKGPPVDVSTDLPHTQQGYFTGTIAPAPTLKVDKINSIHETWKTISLQTVALQ